MFCPHCGKETPDTVAFCAACGGRLRDVAGAPSASTSSDPYAGFWRRAAAYILDTIIVYAAMFTIGFIVILGAGDGAGTSALLTVLAWPCSWLYFALFESSALQATPGKKALGVKVTNEHGGRIGFGRATGRHFAKILSGMVLCIGYLMAAFTRRRQGLHDLMAGTLVVKNDASEQELSGDPGARPLAAGVIVLIVIAALVPIIGILAAIAIPAYQDYTIRAQIAEGLNVAAPYRAAVAELLASGRTPTQISGGDVPLGLPPETRYVKSIDVANSIVVVTYGKQANRSIADKQLVLVPAVSDDEEIAWVCGRASPPGTFEPVLPRYAQYTNVENKYLPRNCRE